MPEAPPPAASPLVLPPRLLAEWPHLPAFWPERQVRAAAAGEAAPLPFTPLPFRPARLGGREVPVALVLGAPPDPLGDALAAGCPGPAEERIRAVLAHLAAARIGAPPGLSDPGPAALGVAPGSAILVLDPCAAAEAAPAAARLEAARAAGRAAGQPVLAVRDPFAAGPPVLPGSLPAQDPWTLLDAAAELRGASRPLALLALAAGVTVRDGTLAGADPLETWGAVLAATRCVDPFRGTPCDIHDALDLLALWKTREADRKSVV